MYPNPNLNLHGLPHKKSIKPNRVMMDVEKCREVGGVQALGSARD
jgi:hypothetical protein